MTDELEQPDVRPETVRLREQLDAAYGAIRDLGRQVRALRAKLTEAEQR
jgi:hypothetical protein